MEFRVPIEGLPVCDHCEGTPSFYCAECKQYYCSQLAEIHRTGKKTSAHQLKEYSPSSDVVVVKQVLNVRRTLS